MRPTGISKGVRRLLGAPTRLYSVFATLPRAASSRQQSGLQVGSAVPPSLWEAEFYSPLYSPLLSLARTCGYVIWQKGGVLSGPDLIREPFKAENFLQLSSEEEVRASKHDKDSIHHCRFGMEAAHVKKWGQP